MINLVFYCTTELRALSTTARKNIYLLEIGNIVSWEITFTILLWFNFV
jgi:hypothetical protein